MLEPSDLLAQAKNLAGKRKGKPRQTDLARAISSAYYAIFHYLLRQMADAIVGVTSRGTAAYELAYRSVDHGTLAILCADVTKPTLPARYPRTIGMPTHFGTDIGDCATAFTTLQELRHQADYSPRKRFLKSDALAAIAQAHQGMEALERAPDGERRVFLFLIAFPVRR